MLRSEQDTVRRIVREEITAALKVLAQAARDLDVPYETDRLERVALEAITNAADRAVYEMTQKETTDGT